MDTTKTAVAAGGGIVVTGKPTLWLWNAVLPWAFGANLEHWPMMPSGEVSLFFGGLAMLVVYGLVSLWPAKSTKGKTDG